MLECKESLHIGLADLKLTEDIRVPRRHQNHSRDRELSDFCRQISFSIVRITLDVLSKFCIGILKYLESSLSTKAVKSMLVELKYVRGILETR